MVFLIITVITILAGIFCEGGAVRFDTSTTLTFTATAKGQVHLEIPVRTHTLVIHRCWLDTIPPGQWLPFTFKYCHRRKFHQWLGSPPNCTLKMTLTGTRPDLSGKYRLVLNDGRGQSELEFSIQNFGEDVSTVSVTTTDHVTTDEAREEEEAAIRLSAAQDVSAVSVITTDHVTTDVAREEEEAATRLSAARRDVTTHHVTTADEVREEEEAATRLSPARDVSADGSSSSVATDHVISDVARPKSESTKPEGELQAAEDSAAASDRMEDFIHTSKLWLLVLGGVVALLVVAVGVSTALVIVIKRRVSGRESRVVQPSPHVQMSVQTAGEGTVRVCLPPDGQPHSSAEDNSNPDDGWRDSSNVYDEIPKDFVGSSGDSDDDTWSSESQGSPYASWTVVDTRCKPPGTRPVPDVDADHPPCCHLPASPSYLTP